MCQSFPGTREGGFQERRKEGIYRKEGRKAVGYEDDPFLFGRERKKDRNVFNLILKVLLRRSNIDHSPVTLLARILRWKINGVRVFGLLRLVLVERFRGIYFVGSAVSLPTSADLVEVARDSGKNERDLEKDCQTGNVHNVLQLKNNKIISVIGCQKVKLYFIY